MPHLHKSRQRPRSTGRSMVRLVPRESTRKMQRSLQTVPFTSIPVHVGGFKTQITDQKHRAKHKAGRAASSPETQSKEKRKSGNVRVWLNFLLAQSSYQITTLGHTALSNQSFQENLTAPLNKISVGRQKAASQSTPPCKPSQISFKTLPMLCS